MARPPKERTKFGFWLENKRLSENETVEEQAKRIGVHFTSISHYSRGMRPLSTKFLYKVEKAYNLQGEERKDMYKTTLTKEDIENAKKIKSDMSAEDIAVQIKYGLSL